MSKHGHFRLDLWDEPSGSWVPICDVVDAQVEQEEARSTAAVISGRLVGLLSRFRDVLEWFHTSDRKKCRFCNLCQDSAEPPYQYGDGVLTTLEWHSRELRLTASIENLSTGEDHG